MPSRYSKKLDCFSHGVVTIQIVTRQFPNPGDAHVKDPKEGSFRQVPERERRKKDINLVDPNHPLLPLALHCLKDDDTERLSADDLFGRLATLKGEQMYTRSVEQSREQSVSVQTLQQQIRQREDELARARASHQQQVQEKENELQTVLANHETELRESYDTFRRQIQEKDGELARTRANHEAELRECHDTFQRQIQEVEGELINCQQKVQEKEYELERVRANHETQYPQEKSDELERAETIIIKHQSMIEQLQDENCKFRKQQKAGVSQKLEFLRKQPKNHQ